MKSPSNDSVFWFGILLLTLWVLNFGMAATAFGVGCGTMEKFAHFGDSFNLITSLFSGFALCGTVYALVIQIRQRKADDHKLMTSKVELILTSTFKARLTSFAIIASCDSAPAKDQSVELFQLEAHLSEIELFTMLYFKQRESLLPPIREAVQALTQASSDYYKEAIKGKASNVPDSIFTASVALIKALDELNKVLVNENSFLMKGMH